MNEISSAMDNVKNTMNEAKEKLINWFSWFYLISSAFILLIYHMVQIVTAIIKSYEMIEINVHALFWIFKTSSSAQ